MPKKKFESNRSVHTFGILRALILHANGYFISSYSGTAMGGKGLTIDGQIRLRFAYAYGFRNIQNIVQKLKRNKCDHDFVEIMACPSGCINGGGHIRRIDVNLNDVRQMYETLPHLNQPLDLRIDDNHIPLFTEYHSIEKNMSNAFNLKW